MSKVKINVAEYESLQTGIEKTFNCIMDALDEWDQNFANLNYSFLTSGFLEKLYKDAKSNYRNLSWWEKHISTIFSDSVRKRAAASKETYVAKKNFTNLLTSCNEGRRDEYVQLGNAFTMIRNTRTALVEVLTKINEYNRIYGNLVETYNAQGLKTTLAADGYTILGVNTTAYVNGQQIELTVSEAMNAFYTYESSVMEGEMMARYLHREYGYSKQFVDIVLNANAFMASSISSGLYTHEFIDGLLPNYNPISKELGITQRSKETNIDEDIIQDAFSHVGEGAASMLGVGMLGQVDTSGSKKKTIEEEKVTGTKETESKTSSTSSIEDKSNSKSSIKSSLSIKTANVKSTAVPTTTTSTVKDNTNEKEETKNSITNDLLDNYKKTSVEAKLDVTSAIQAENESVKSENKVINNAENKINNVGAAIFDENDSKEMSSSQESSFDDSFSITLDSDDTKIEDYNYNKVESLAETKDDSKDLNELELSTGFVSDSNNSSIAAIANQAIYNSKTSKTKKAKDKISLENTTNNNATTTANKKIEVKKEDVDFTVLDDTILN